MTDYARKLLDTLMGFDRDEPVKRQRKYDEEAICKNFLVAFCPNELFTNTKSDLGYCTSLHDDRLRTEFQQAYKLAVSGSQQINPDMGDNKDILRNFSEYETKFFYGIREILRDLDKRIRRGLERLQNKGDAEVAKLQAATREERNEQIVLIQEKISQLQQKIEQFGDEGLIDEAKELDQEVEELQRQLLAIRAEQAKEKEMTVCQVCGSLIVVDDDPERILAHNSGKQHLGFQKLRQSYESLQDKYEGERRRQYERAERERLEREQSQRGQYDRDNRDRQYYSRDHYGQRGGPQYYGQQQQQQYHQQGYGGYQNSQQNYQRRSRSPPRYRY